MQITLYKNFSKRINSTKRPEDGTNVNVYIKDDTSIESPTFIIDGVDLEVNYCRAFGHYYYINDIVVGNNNIYELKCTQDVLATYKDDINALNAMVEYSQSAFNVMIPDSRLTMTDEVEFGSSEAVGFVNTAGSFVLTVVGNAADATGFTDIWNITASELEALIDYMYTDDVLERLQKIFTKPYDCIVSCKWIPWNISGNFRPIYLGDTLSGSFGIPLSIETKSYTHVTRQLTIVRRYGDFRDYAPYSNYLLYLPFYGSVTLDANSLAGFTTIDVEMVLDNVTGEIQYTLHNGSHVFGYYSANAAVDMNIAQLTANVAGAGAAIAGGAIATGAAIASMVATGGATTPLVGAAIGGVGSIVSGASTYFTDLPSTKGGNGGYARAMTILKEGIAGVKNLHLIQISHKLSMAPSAIASKAGRPLFATRTLGDLSGFVKCSGASISIEGLGDDKQQLNAWLNQGIYLE